MSFSFGSRQGEPSEGPRAPLPRCDSEGGLILGRHCLSRNFEIHAKEILPFQPSRQNFKDVITLDVSALGPESVIHFPTNQASDRNVSHAYDHRFGS